MAKDKRKKKYFQGLEHLRKEHENAPTQGTITSEEFLPSARFLKKDLTKVLIMVCSFLIILAGLTIIDKKTEILSDLASKITAIFIK